MTKYNRVYYSTLITKNPEVGGAFLVHIVKLDDDRQPAEHNYSAWRTLTVAKRYVADYLGKRPRWEINEDKTEANALTDVKVAI